MANKNNLETIPLGSGILYSLLLNDTVKELLKDDTGLNKLIAMVEKRENIVGWVSGGASLEYKPDTYTAEDDLGYVRRTIITKEETTLKTGVCTWNANTLNQLSSTGRVTEDLNKRILRIGGIANDRGEEYVLIFHHIDKELGDSLIIVTGKNTAGFTIQFQKDKETTLDDEIKANTLDDEGTQVIYYEYLPETTLHVESKEGSTTGKTKITVDEPIQEKNSYVYKVDDTIVIPVEGENCSGLTAWDGTAEIAAASNKQLLLVEVDSSKKAVKAGLVSVVSKA